MRHSSTVIGRPPRPPPGKRATTRSTGPGGSAAQRQVRRLIHQPHGMACRVTQAIIIKRHKDHAFLGIGVVFVGALRYVIMMAWGDATEKPHAESAGLVDKALVYLPLAALLLLGLWMPGPLHNALTQAAAILGGGR